jgi:ABC-type arginine transport system permease subunit
LQNIIDLLLQNTALNSIVKVAEQIYVRAQEATTRQEKFIQYYILYKAERGYSN